MEVLYTVKPVTQPAGYTGFLSLEVRVKFEGGLYLRAGNILFFAYKRSRLIVFLAKKDEKWP